LQTRGFAADLYAFAYRTHLQDHIHAQDLRSAEFDTASHQLFEPGRFGGHLAWASVTEGQIRNLVINLPPRHMKLKSLAASVFWPWWEWIQETRAPLPCLSPGTHRI
jgi:hypothetical protein